MRPGSVCRHLKIAGRVPISRFFQATSQPPRKLQHIQEAGPLGLQEWNCGNMLSTRPDTCSTIELRTITYSFGGSNVSQPKPWHESTVLGASTRHFEAHSEECCICEIGRAHV